jgi:hypothetical protein
MVYCDAFSFCRIHDKRFLDAGSAEDHRLVRRGEAVRLDEVRVEQELIAMLRTDPRLVDAGLEVDNTQDVFSLLHSVRGSQDPSPAIAQSAFHPGQRWQSRGWCTVRS